VILSQEDCVLKASKQSLKTRKFVTAADCPDDTPVELASLSSDEVRAIPSIAIAL